MPDLVLDPDLQAAVDFAKTMEPYHVSDRRLERAFRSPTVANTDYSPLGPAFRYLDCTDYVVTNPNATELQNIHGDVNTNEIEDCGCPSQVKDDSLFYGVQFPKVTPDDVRLEFLEWLAGEELILPYMIVSTEWVLRPSHVPAYAEAQQRFRNICREYGEPRT